MDRIGVKGQQILPLTILAPHMVVEGWGRCKAYLNKNRFRGLLVRRSVWAQGRAIPGQPCFRTLS